MKIAGLSPWWYGKMVTLLALIVWAIASGVNDGWASWLMVLAGQGLVALGAGINLWHFVILKRRAKNLGAPRELVTAGGLLRQVRHPMYLGESILVLGFATLSGSLFGWLLAAVYWVCISWLCVDEDRDSANRFSLEFKLWQKRSTRLVPGLW